MSVRSKQQPAARYSAKILELPVIRKASTPNSVSLRSRPAQSGSKSSPGAALLSIRQHLTFKASMVITDLNFIAECYSRQVADKLVAHVRELLDHEFGPLRVHKRHEGFVVNHHCMESLVAGLLRVQFHSCQIPLAATRNAKGLGDKCGVPLCWGVGQTVNEAEAERLNKQTS